MGSPYNKQPVKFPWVTGRVHGVAKPNTVCDTHDRKTAGLPYLCYSLGMGCRRGCGWVWVCKGWLWCVWDVVGAVQLCWMQGIDNDLNSLIASG